MIIGSYPCCDEPLMIELPEQTPSFAREECPTCGHAVWHRFSRLDPQSWTEEQFLEEFNVDHETKKITPRNEVEKPQIDPVIAGVLSRLLAQSIIGGPSMRAPPEQVDALRKRYGLDGDDT